MTAAESFDAGIARQIGHCADASGYPSATTTSSSSGHQGLPGTAHCRATWPGQATQAWKNIQTTLSQAGASLSAIVSVRQWLTSAEDVRAYVEARSKFITQ
jgi:2-iminobutanoate/2-iminopropanoate deaminase